MLMSYYLTVLYCVQFDAEKDGRITFADFCKLVTKAYLGKGKDGYDSLAKAEVSFAT